MRIIDDSPQMFGKNVYYIPRTLVKEDSIFGEDTLSRYTGAFEVEVYLEDAGGFGATACLFTFGVRIQVEFTFNVSKRRFTAAVDDSALSRAGVVVRGDLIHFPMVGKTFRSSM